MYLRPSRYHSKGSSLLGFSSISIGDFVENFGGSGGRLDWHKCDLKSCLDDVKRPLWCVNVDPMGVDQDKIYGKACKPKTLWIFTNCNILWKWGSVFYCKVVGLTSFIFSINFVLLDVLYQWVSYSKHSTDNHNITSTLISFEAHHLTISPRCCIFQAKLRYRS